MKRLYGTLFLILTVIFTGCFSDEGNYDYKDIQKITIKFKELITKTTVGETVEVDPILNIDIDETSPNHTFMWTLNGETRPEWNKRKFVYKVEEPLPESDLILNITDKRTDVVYSGLNTLQVIGIYTNDNSWMILSDKDGESLLSFLAVTELKEKVGSAQSFITKSQFIPDVYTSANDGVSLGKGPIALQERFRESTDYFETDKALGNVSVFQESGAVDLNGESFAKEIDIAQSFYGGHYPQGVSVRPGSYMYLTDVIADQDGKLYSRIKSSQYVFNSEYFLHTPLKVEGETEVLTKCIVSRGQYAYNRFCYAIIYDGKNKRLLSIKDNDAYTSIGKIEPILKYSPNLEQKGTVPLDDFTGYDMLYIKQGADNEGYGFHMILKNEAGELFDQYFVMKESTWGAPTLVKSVTISKINGLPSTPECIAIPNEHPRDYAFFSVGNTLYMLDIENITKESAKVYYTFDSKITCLNSDSYYSGPGHLAVGLEDGTFYVIGINEAKNVKTDEDKILYKSTEKVGKIVDIQYKNNRAFNY